MNSVSRFLFGQMLINDGIITVHQLEEGLAEQAAQRSRGKEVQKIGTILHHLGYLEKTTLEKYVDQVVLDEYRG